MAERKTITKAQSGDRVIHIFINESDYSSFESNIEFAREVIEKAKVETPEIFPESMCSHYKFMGYPIFSRSQIKTSDITN